MYKTLGYKCLFETFSPKTAFVPENSDEDRNPQHFIHMTIVDNFNVVLNMKRQSLKNLKINRDLIHNCILKATNSELTPIERQNNGVKTVRYTIDASSILDIFYNKNGTTSMTCCGKDPELANLVANEIIATCVVDLPEPTRALYLKNLSQENFDTIIQRFKSQDLTVADLEDTEYSKRYTITNTNDESIKVHYFPSTGALNFQGKGYSIYSDLVESMGNWVSVNDVIGSNLAVNNIETITEEELVKAMKDALPVSFDFLKGAIANIMASSFFLTKIENKNFPDYSWMVYPILRGLEGVLKKMLIIKGIRINKNFGEVFEPDAPGSTTYKLHQIHSKAINDAEFCDLMIKCYNYLSANRHGIFHINGIIKTTRLLSRENALEMFNEIIDLIETTYTKVKAKVAA